MSRLIYTTRALTLGLSVFQCILLLVNVIYIDRKKNLHTLHFQFIGVPLLLNDTVNSEIFVRVLFS